MTSFVIRHRDRKRREQMIDEAVRLTRRAFPATWCLADICGPFQPDNFAMVFLAARIRDVYRRLAAK